MDDHGFFALAGFPAEFTVESESQIGNERIKDIVIRGGFSTGLGKAFERGAYDYLETTAGKHVPGLPQSYGGVSGGWADRRKIAAVTG